MAEKKYIVAPGCSFIGGGKTYGEGDEISVSVFGEGEKAAARFKSFLSGDKPKIIEGKPAEKKAAPEKLNREKLEEIAIKANFKKEEIAGYNDEELEKVLKGYGLIK